MGRVTKKSVGKRKLAARRAATSAQNRLPKKPPSSIVACSTSTAITRPSGSADKLLGKLKSNKVKDIWHRLFGEKYSDGIKIKGPKEYREKVKRQLDTLKGTKSGGEILNALNKQGREGKGVTIVQADSLDDTSCIPKDRTKAYPEKSNFESATGRIKITKAGVGTSSTVRFDPDIPYPFSDGSGNLKPEVVIGHELLHAKHNGEGRNLRNHLDPTDPRPGGSNHEEAQTIGRGAYKNDYPTENTLRKEMGITNVRKSHGQL